MKQESGNKTSRQKRLKPGWLKTDIPKPVRIELYRIIRDYPTRSAQQQAVAGSEALEKLEKQFGETPNSADTFKRLAQEVRTMPPSEVASLPMDLQRWMVELRPGLRDDAGACPSAPIETNLDPILIAAKLKHIDDLLAVAVRWCEVIGFPPAIFLCNLGPEGLTDLSCVLTDTHYRPARGSFRSVLLEGQYGLEDDVLFQCLQEHLKGHDIGRDSAEWLRLASGLKTACTALFDRMNNQASQDIASAHGSLYSKDCLRARERWGEYLDALKPSLGDLYHRVKESSQPVAVVGSRVVVYSPDGTALSAIDLHSRGMKGPLKEVLGVDSVSTFRPNRYPALLVHADNYAKSVYQYVVGQDFLRQDAAARQHINYWYGGKLDYRTAQSGRNSNDWPYKLWFGEALLAEFTDGAVLAVRALRDHHEAMVSKYASSTEVAHIGELATKLNETGRRMTDGVTLLRQKAALPGSCRACPAT